VLTYYDRGDEDVYRKYGLGAKRRSQILRMATEAVDQGGLLSQEDVAQILGNDVRTIRKDIQELKKQGLEVPTRGQQKDIGPGKTHS